MKTGCIYKLIGEDDEDVFYIVTDVDVEDLVENKAVPRAEIIDYLDDMGAEYQIVWPEDFYEVQWPEEE